MSEFGVDVTEGKHERTRPESTSMCQKGRVDVSRKRVLEVSEFLVPREVEVQFSHELPGGGLSGLRIATSRRIELATDQHPASGRQI